MVERETIEDEIKRKLKYEPETGLLFWKTITEENQNDRMRNTRFSGKEAGWKHHTGYKYLEIRDKTFSVHRVVWLLYYGSWPDGDIDHINQRRLDNRIFNLRDVTPTVNGRNKAKSKRNKSGVTGVIFREDCKKWFSSIRVSGKLHHLGSFKTLEEAAEVRYEAEKFYGFHKNHGKRFSTND